MSVYQKAITLDCMHDCLNEVCDNRLPVDIFLGSIFHGLRNQISQSHTAQLCWCRRFSHMVFPTPPLLCTTQQYHVPLHLALAGYANNRIMHSTIQKESCHLKIYLCSWICMVNGQVIKCHHNTLEGQSAAQQRHTSGALLTWKDLAGLSRNIVWWGPKPVQGGCACLFHSWITLIHWLQAGKLQELMSPLYPDLHAKDSRITACYAVLHQTSKYGSMHALAL